MFGCPRDDTDDMLHYSVCPLVQDWGSRRLNIPRVNGLMDRRNRFMMLEVGMERNPNLLCRCALRAAAVHASHNLHRQIGSPPDQAIASLEQTLKNMVEGHAGAASCVAHAFAR